MIDTEAELAMEKADLVVGKKISVIAEVGELVLDEKGAERTVKKIIINEDKTVTYKLDEGHSLVLIGEDKHEATFECQYCRSRIAFALPGSGEPAAHGKPGAWEPDPEFAKWMDPCST
jgi:hypothetical protein